MSLQTLLVILLIAFLAMTYDLILTGGRRMVLKPGKQIHGECRCCDTWPKSAIGKACPNCSHPIVLGK